MSGDGDDDQDGAWGAPAEEAGQLDPPLDAFAGRVSAMLDKSEKTQRQIARELGYRHPNIVSMFKTGVTRVPIDKVAPLAFALDTDEAELVDLWLSTYMPEAKALLERAIGGQFSAAERSWVEGLRRIYGRDVPPLDTDAEAVLRLLAKRRGEPQAPR